MSLFSMGELYKSPFKIQSRKRSTKLILTQSVDQTKLNKPHTINTISSSSSVVLQLVKIIEIMSPCHNITICNNTTAVGLCKLTNIVHKLHFVWCSNFHSKFSISIQSCNQHIYIYIYIQRCDEIKIIQILILFFWTIFKIIKIVSRSK